jgi:RHS repeat-associated protein
LYQVKDDAVGTLNTNRTAIGGVPKEDETFTYDPVGNWLAYQKNANGSSVLDQTRSNNRDNQLTQIDGSSQGIEYDRAGNAIKIRPGAGGDWNKHFTLVWDAWNRLVEVKDENGVTVQKNAYDGLSRRITKEAGGTVTHTYWSDRWKPLEERDGSATTAARSYLWGERPGHRDELVLRDRDTDGNGTLDERLYATMDYFNGTAILNTSGAVQERYAYSAFGERRVMTTDFLPRASSLFAWDFGFQGQFRDNEIGWYNYGHRFYVPLLGRWINRDPIGDSGGNNLYLFCENHPRNTVDYTGLCAAILVSIEEIVILTIGAILVVSVVEIYRQYVEAYGRCCPTGYERRSRTETRARNSVLPDPCKLKRALGLPGMEIRAFGSVICIYDCPSGERTKTLGAGATGCPETLPEDEMDL